MLTQETLLKLGKIHQQEMRLREQAIKLKEKLKGQGVTGCYYGMGDGSIGMEITLAAYLALWPDETPTLRTWPCDDGTTKGCLEYPWHSVGVGLDNKTIWVNATSPAVAMPHVADKQTGAQLPKAA